MGQPLGFSGHSPGHYRLALVDPVDELRRPIVVGQIYSDSTFDQACMREVIRCFARIASNDSRIVHNLVVMAPDIELVQTARRFIE